MTATTTSPTTTVHIEFLYLDLSACSRCRGTDDALRAALDLTRDVLAASGARVTVNKVHVTSAAVARDLRFVSSPTIRVNGTDIALDLRESPCESETCADDCGDAIDCRIWVHQEREYLVPPVPMIIEAILRRVYGTRDDAPADTEPFALPENLERFFADTAPGDQPTGAGCCPPATRDSCCEPDEKAECCGTGTGSSCGCQ